MDNKLRIKRVKDGINLLEKGKVPYEDSVSIKQALGLSYKGDAILYWNGLISISDQMEANGFKYSFDKDDFNTLLHNWKRFLELIENL